MFAPTGIPYRGRLEALERCCHSERYPSWIIRLFFLLYWEQSTHARHVHTLLLLLIVSIYSQLPSALDIASVVLSVATCYSKGGEEGSIGRYRRDCALYTTDSLDSSRGWWIIAMTSSTGITLRACSERGPTVIFFFECTYTNGS